MASAQYVFQPGSPARGVTSSSRDVYNPTLVPQWYPLSVSYNNAAPGMLSTTTQSSPSTTQGAAPARAYASVSTTIALVPVAGDVITTTITHPLFAIPLVVTTTLLAGDTTAIRAAERIVSTITTNVTCASLGITASNISGVLTVSWPGPVGNSASVAFVKTSGTGTETFTPASGTMTGGSGYVIPFDNFNWSFGGPQTQWYFAGNPIFVDAAVVNKMVLQGMPIF